MTIPRLARAAILLMVTLAARSLSAQAPSELPRLRAHFPDDSIHLPPRPELEPGGLIGPRTPPALVALRWRQSAERAIASARRERRLAWVLPPAPSLAAVAPSDTMAQAAAPPVTPPSPGALSPLGRYADVGVELHSRLELKMDRLKNERCTAFDISTLTPGCRNGFPTPAIGQQFSLRAGGVVSQRFHVNVDYDTEREFSASNNINVYYQGLQDEILQRVDIGNVTFDVPRSRFISAGVPANSFGIQALAQVGPVEFRTIVAQQRGSSLRSRVFDIGVQATQPVDRESRDLDFEPGRFFFVVDPRNLPGYPAVDILNLRGGFIPPAERVVAARVYRLRAQSGQSGTNPNLGGIDAVAVRRDSPQRVGPFSWERLVEGRDYYLDPSGAWFALATRVGTEDFLAVSYVTANGDTVGTFPAVNRGGDTLALVYEPRRGPEVPTFAYEMRNVYRVAGGDVTRSSVELAIVLNESERPIDGNGTYLGRLGLARANDPSTLDQFNRVFPRERDPNGGLPLKDLFIVFPHLRPFADSARLDPRELNDSLYRTPSYLLSTQGAAPQFRLRLHYEASGAGDRSTLSLGAFQIRDGSEKLFIGSRELVRDRDYQIAYDLGVVTFLNPDSLFLGPVQVRAQFEENQRFDDAPKNNVGFSTTYHLGSVGSISAVGLYQSEQSAFTRPPLGFEPRSGLIGGLSADLNFRGSGLTRALNSLPMVRTAVPSSLSLRGELDMTRPNPNSRGQAYVEEFEGLSALPIRLVQNMFQLGSRPSSGRGLAAPFLAPDGTLAPTDAVPLVWQNAIQFGSTPLEFQPQQIDSSIVIAGATRAIETVLWLTLKPDTVGGAPDPISGRPRWLRPHTPGPRWRSITQSLDPSGLGVDLSRTEYVEFWVLDDADRTARAQSAALLFDFGRVLEDATSIAPDTLRVVGSDTVFSGFRFTGVGRLDTEKDSLTNAFNAAVNDLGIHGDRVDSMVNAATGQLVRDVSTCQLPSGGVPTFPLGDLAADCTRLDGFADTEDLDGDNRLDTSVGVTQEDVIRYVFSFSDDRYYVRDGARFTDPTGRMLTWRLYRIPFRTDTLQIGQPNVRQIRSVRITLAAPNLGNQEREFSFALARVRLVGAPWVKRAGSPIAGLSGSRAQPHGEVVASIVSTENHDLGYTPPPGVVDQTDRVGAAVQFGSQQINEQSLRILARDLRVGERAEAFIRFTDESDKNFLKYRVLRAWARGHGAGWEDGDLEFFLKVGRDENNFYLYHVPANSQTWDPEVLVNLDRWINLRTNLESSWLRGDPPHGAAECGGDSLAYVACDGPYLVQVRDPGVSPPNLARVSEVAAGIYRRTANVAIAEAELWVDDIRLSNVVSDAGIAGALDARLAAADVAEFNFSVVSKDSKFRQLGDDPTYLGNGAASLASTIQLAKFMPESWGLSVPLTVEHVRTREDPFYISHSDIRADALTGLRRARGNSTAIQATLRRARRGETTAERLFLDPLSLSLASQNAGSTAELSDAQTTNRQLALAYLNPAGPRTLGLPGFLSHVVAGLPSWIRESEFGRSLSQARFRWNPFSLRFASLLTNNRTDRTTFRVPVELPTSTGIPIASINHVWRNEAGIDLRPFNTLIFRMDYSRTQDLQNYGDTTSLGRVLSSERGTFFGKDAGFERARMLNTALSVSPPVGRWFRPRFIVSTSFAFNRDPGGGEPIREGVDSMGGFIAPHALANARRREFGGSADLASLFQTLTGPSGRLGRIFRALQPVDFTLSRELRSSFDRAPFFADFGYQLGFGGIDAFRTQQGVEATGAADIRNRTAAGGLDLPLGLKLRTIYQDLDAVNWVRRLDGQAELRQTSLEWPSGTLSWLYSPRWALSNVVTTITSQARYRRAVTTTVQPSFGDGDDARTENRSTLLSPSLTLTWVGGVLTGFQYGRTIGDAVTSGNVTRSDREDWTGNLSFSFRAPASLMRLRNPLRTSMTFSASDLLVCLTRAGDDECVTVSDSRRRQADLKVDTGFSPTITGGASFGYVLTEQRHTATKLSQVIFTVFAEINFSAGQVR